MLITNATFCQTAHIFLHRVTFIRMTSRAKFSYFLSLYLLKRFQVLIRNTLIKIIFHSRRKGLERLTFCNKFYENRWLGFVDMAICIFINV